VDDLGEVVPSKTTCGVIRKQKPAQLPTVIGQDVYNVGEIREKSHCTQCCMQLICFQPIEVVDQDNN
jgi:hypothetical protein